MRPVRARMGTIVLAAALFAVGCGSSEGTTDAGANSPIAEFLGQEDFFSDDAESQARIAEQEREREETVAACMREQGFEYVPRETSDFNFISSEEGLDYNSREYAEKYGFGMTTQWYSQEEVGPDLVGGPNSPFGSDEANEDPNQEILETMDDSTRQAYEEALYGDPDDFPSFDPETMSEEELAEAEENFDFTPQGCQGEAFADAFNNDFYKEFGDELDDLYEAVQDDPRIAEQTAKINSCVSEKGFDFDAGNDGFEKLFESFQDDLSRIDEMIGGFPGEDLTEEDFAAMTEEELDELFNQPREFTPEAKALLGEIQTEEIELALVVFDCGGGDGANVELFQEISAEYEQQFLDDNADRLSPFKADS